MLLNLLLYSKWKADKHGVRCMRLGPKGSTLLSAGRSIKLWDLETKEALKVTKKLLSDIEVEQNQTSFLLSLSSSLFFSFCALKTLHTLWVLVIPVILKISLVILLTICHRVLVVLAWRIWYWINLLSPIWYFPIFSSLVSLILYWYRKEKFCLGHSWEWKG